MDGDVLTHADIAREIGVSVSTIKNYRSKFPECLPVAREGKPLCFSMATLEVCREIHEAFQDGRSVEEIRDALYDRYPQFQKAQRPKGAGVTRRRIDAQGRGVERVLEQLAEAQGAVLDRVDALEARIASLAGAQTNAGGAPREMLTELAALRREVVALRSEVVGAKSKSVLPRQGATGDDGAGQGEHPVLGEDAGDGAGAGFEAGTAVCPDAAHVDDMSAGSDATESAETDRAAFDGAALPPEQILSLPLVVMGEDGDFLGVPLETGALNARHVAQYMEDAAAGNTSWVRRGGVWRAKVMQNGEPQMFDVKEVTTPRGNTVVQMVRLRVGGKTAGVRYMRSFLRQVRERLREPVA